MIYLAPKSYSKGHTFREFLFLLKSNPKQMCNDFKMIEKESIMEFGMTEDSPAGTLGEFKQQYPDHDLAIKIEGNVVKLTYDKEKKEFNIEF